MHPSSTSIPSLTRARRYMRLHRPSAARRLHWWPSAIWTGTTTWCPGTVHLPSKPRHGALGQSTCLQKRRALHRRRGRLSAVADRGDRPNSREGTCRSSLLAGNCRIFSGRTVCAVCYLPDGSFFTGWQYVWLSLVSQHERVHFLP